MGFLTHRKPVHVDISSISSMGGAPLVLPSVPATSGPEIVGAKQAPQLMELTLTLTDLAIIIDSDDDFGSEPLSAALPAAAVILGAGFDLTFTHADLTGDADTVSMALGSVLTASVDFSNTDEENLRAGVAATGTAAGVCVGAMVAQAAPLPTQDIFLNVEGENTLEATLTVSGTVTIVYLEL